MQKLLRVTDPRSVRFGDTPEALGHFHSKRPMPLLMCNQRRRRDIFVESRPKTSEAPSGAAYFAPLGLEEKWEERFSTKIPLRWSFNFQGQE
ncbi:MAG TPA: hypothetical protein VFV23_14775 [Verrucomicrobiae bacterium]|nr:hypothetical protein [Verrucomicrobiae bacterium]